MNRKDCVYLPPNPANSKEEEATWDEGCEKDDFLPIHWTAIFYRLAPDRVR